MPFQSPLESLLDEYDEYLKRIKGQWPSISWALQKMRYAAVAPPTYPYKPPTKPQLYTAEEAKELGVDIKPDWQLKVTPSGRHFEEEPTVSFVTPTGWELKEGVYVSPEGEELTKEQLSTHQLAYLESLTRIPVEKGVLTPEQLAIERAYREAFVPETIGFRGIFGEGVTKPEMAEITAYYVDKPEELYNDLLVIGRTDETEAILQQLGATEKDIDEIFGMKGLMPQRIPPEGITIPMEAEGEKVDALLKPDFSVWIGDTEVGAINPETGKFEQMEVEWWQKYLVQPLLTAAQYTIIPAVETLHRLFGEIPSAAVWSLIESIPDYIQRFEESIKTGDFWKLPQGTKEWWRFGKPQLEGLVTPITDFDSVTQVLSYMWDAYEKAREQYMAIEAPAWHTGWEKPKWLGGEELTLGVKGLTEALFEIPIWLLIPSAALLRARLAPTAAAGGTVGMTAQAARVALLPIASLETATATGLRYGIGLPLKYVTVDLPRVATRKAFEVALDRGLDKWLVRQGIRANNANRVVAYFLKTNHHWLYRKAQENLINRLAAHRAAGEKIVPQHVANSAAKQTMEQAEPLLLKAAREAAVSSGLEGMPLEIVRAITNIAERMSREGFRVTDPMVFLRLIPEAAQAEFEKTIPLMLQLRDMGYSIDAITAMAPEEAWVNLLKRFTPEVGTAPIKETPTVSLAEYTTEEITALEAELAGLREWLAFEPAVKLRNLIKKCGWYKGEVSDLTLKQYQDIKGREEIPPNILAEDKKHVRWEYALDDVATEMGYESGDALKYAIEDIGNAFTRIESLERELALAVTEGLPKARIPVMITKAMEADLQALGYSDEAISAMTPAEAWNILRPRDAMKLEERITTLQMDEIIRLGKEKMLVSEADKPTPALRNLLKGLVGKDKIDKLTASEADTIVEALELLEVKYGKPPKIPTTTGLITKEFADKIPLLKEVGILERLRPTRQVFQKMGLRAEVSEPAFEAEIKIYEDLMAFRAELKGIRSLVPKGRERAVFRALENPGEVVELTANEQKALAWFRKYFEDWAGKLKIPREKIKKNYVTHIFEAEIAQMLKAGHPLDPALIRALDFVTPKTVFNPFLQKRLGQTIGLKENPFAAAEAYEARALKVYHYEPLIQKIRVYEKYLPPNAARYLRSFITRITSRPLPIDREANQTLKEFASKIEKLPGGDLLAKHLTSGNASGLLAYRFASSLYFLWLGFKPTSAIRNLSQHLLALCEVGPIHFLGGFGLRATSEGKAVLKESLVLRSRRQAFLPGIDASFTDRWTDKTREVAMYMFRWADKQNVSDAFLSGYAEAKGLGLPRDWCIKRGDEVAADTQYIYTQLGGMAWSQPALGRAVSVLTTWPQNWVELMTRWFKGRPSYVFSEYEAATGKTLPRPNWLLRRKALFIYLAIVASGYAIKEETRIRAWEYTGLTSLRYLADLAGGEFPALQYPGAVAKVIVGFLTDDDRMLNEGWYQLKPTNLMGIVRQLDQVIRGEKDWLTLLFYLKGKDFFMQKLKEDWGKELDVYYALETAGERYDFREANPETEAKLFIIGRITRLHSDEARDIVLRLIEEHSIDPELIEGYEAVFGTDTAAELAEVKKQIGQIEEDKLFTTNKFTSEVNRLVDLVGRGKVERDGMPLAIEYLRASDQWQGYFDLDAEARPDFRKRFPEIEAQLFFWGKLTTVKSPESAKMVIDLMEKYGIPPEGIRAFAENMDKYDEVKDLASKVGVSWLSTKWYPMDEEYDTLEGKEARQAFLEAHPDYAKVRRQRDAYNYGFPDNLIDTYAEYYSKPRAGYEDEWFLMEHPDFYNACLDLLDWKAKDFSKVPGREVYTLLQEYEEIVEGKARLLFRHEHPELEKWFVDVKGYTPVGDRWQDEEEEEVEAKAEIEKTEEEGEEERLSGELQDLLDEYNRLSEGQERLIFRHENPDLEKYLVEEKGYTPVGDRWKVSKSFLEQLEEQGLLEEWMKQFE